MYSSIRDYWEMTVYQTLCLDLGTHKYIRHNLWLQGDNVIEETVIQANYNHILTFRAQKRDHMRGCLIQLPYFRDELTMKSKKIKKPAQVPKGRRGTSTLCFWPPACLTPPPPHLSFLPGWCWSWGQTTFGDPFHTPTSITANLGGGCYFPCCLGAHWTQGPCPTHSWLTHTTWVITMCLMN